MHFQIQQKDQHSEQQPIPQINRPVISQPQPPVHQSTSYRPDIDGLRTVAITLVIIYHAWPKALPGGFIGVDIFFVISGYLITQIIVKQTLKNRFSYLDFYSRRIKRIYPALLIVLVFTLIIAVKFSSKDQAELTFNTLEASTLFGANIQILLHDQGYFDLDIRANPLLHLWSLGVEEQFYIFWPFLVGIVLKRWQNKALFIFGAYTLLSFIFQIVYVFLDIKMAFYFPFFRFWQMAIGGILAYMSVTIQNKIINNALSGVAFLAIFIGMFVITEKSRFPGFWALLPTLSSAFIIQAKNQALINKHILSSKLFVSIGKISYSLYLWHWPLLVFSKTFFPNGSTSILSNTFFIVFLTFLLTIATYFLAEDPLRKMKGRKIVMILFSLMMVLGLTTLIINKKILPQLQKQKQAHIRQFLKQAEVQIKPREEDFVQKNGKKYPNLSFSKNRTWTTSVEKVKVHRTDERFQLDHPEQIEFAAILQRNVDETSIYFKKNRPELKFFASANEGKQNMVLLVGDSHTLKLSYRFQQLFFDSKAQNKLDEFPTIVAIMYCDAEDRLKYHQEMMKFSLDFARQHKPKRVFIVNHWYNRFCEMNDDPLSDPANCHPQRIDNYTSYIVNHIRQYEEMGIQVSLNAFDIENHQLHPDNMIDFNGVIEENIKPFKLSDFRRKYQPIIDQFSAAINTTKAKFIDLSDNLCWEDTCHVLTPAGYGAYIDNNHYGRFYTRHWMTSVDHLVKFN